MATFDEMMVRFLFDTSDLEKGAKRAEETVEKTGASVAAAAGKGEKASNEAASAIIAGLNRLAAAMEKGGDSAEKQAKRQAEGNKKVAASFEGAIRTGLTFLAVLAGARTVEQFTRQITALDAALGRTAYSMGQSPQALSAVGKAVERMGGDFNGAVGGLRALSDAYQDFRTAGSSALIEPLTRLQALSGKAVSFGRDTLANFESIADALQALDQKGEHALADRLGRQILGSDDLTNLAKRGGAAVRAEIAESRRHGVVDPKDVKAAQDLQNAYTGLSQSVVGLGTKIETALSPYLTKLLRQLDDLIDKHGAEWVAEFSAYLDKHKPNIEAFGNAVLGLVTGADKVASAFDKQSPMVVALEAFAGLLTLRLLNPLNAVLAAMRAIGKIPLTGALAVLGGAGYLANNTMSNVDPWADQSAGETALRALDPGAADRVYGKRGEQIPHGPRHGVGTKAEPHDDRTLWQRTMPKILGGKDAPEGAHLRQRRAHAEADRSLPQGPVPGANGYGLTNAYWRGPLDGKGEGGQLGPREMFDYLKASGASDNEAVMLTGAASSESSFNPNAKHDPAYPGGPPTGHGLFGHKDKRLDMRGKNWQEQSLSALHELRGMKIKGRSLADMLASARTPEEIADVEMHYEGPRGYHYYNPRGGDNYMGRLNSIRRFSAMTGHPAAVSPTAQAPAPAGIPGPVVTDGEAFAARQRLAAGGRDPKDIETRDRYLRQQNGPKPPAPADAPKDSGWHQSPLQYTKGDGSNALTRLYKDGALKVELTDGSTRKLGEVTVGHAARQFLHAMHRSQQLLRHSASVQHPPSVMHGIPHAMDHHRELMAGARMAAFHHHAVTNHIDRSSTSETKIGSLTVHTQAKDAQGLASDLDAIYQRAAAAGRRNYGQA